MCWERIVRNKAYKTMNDDSTLRDCVFKHGVAVEMLKDFRPNTSLGTIVKDYESRIKEIEKTNKKK